MGGCLSTQPPQEAFRPSTPADTCPTYNVALVGDTSVGKTCIASYCVSGRFPETTQPTIGALHKTVMVEDNEKNTFQLSLRDTPGDVHYANFMVNCLHHVDAVWLVWACDDSATLEALPDWVQKIREERPESVPIFLLGNKYDLVARVPQDAVDAVIQQVTTNYENVRNVGYVSARDPTVGIPLRDVMIATGVDELVQDCRKERLDGQPQSLY